MDEEKVVLPELTIAFDALGERHASWLSTPEKSLTFYKELLAAPVTASEVNTAVERLRELREILLAPMPDGVSAEAMLEWAHSHPLDFYAMIPGDGGFTAAVKKAMGVG